GFFGEGVSLEGNKVSGRRVGFVKRWVETRGLAFLEGESFLLPVRHGEGRVRRSTSEWAAGVRPFLAYQDSVFSNGSFENVAGLCAERGEIRVVGLMPHPEIAARPLDTPDALAVEWPEEKRSSLMEYVGDGSRLVRALMEWAESDA